MLSRAVYRRRAESPPGRTKRRFGKRRSRVDFLTNKHEYQHVAVGQGLGTRSTIRDLLVHVAIVLRQRVKEYGTV